MLELILLVLGGALVAEGLFYALLPDQAKRMAQAALQMQPQFLRIMGVVALALGVGLFWLARSL
jgi:uncharacterized protein